MSLLRGPAPEWLRARHWTVKVATIYGLTAAVLLPTLELMNRFLRWAGWEMWVYIPTFFLSVCMAFGIPSFLGVRMGFGAGVGLVLVFAAVMGWPLLVELARLIVRIGGQ